MTTTIDTCNAYTASNARAAAFKEFLSSLSADDCTVLLHMTATRLHELNRTAAPVAAPVAADNAAPVAAAPVKALWQEETIVLARNGKTVFTKPNCKLSGRQRSGIRKAAVEMGATPVPVGDAFRNDLCAAMGDDRLTIVCFKTVKAAKAFMESQSEYFSNRK